MAGILLAILILSIVIMFHEFGHFLLAKANHIVVTEFSLGFGPRILSFQKGETRYSWKAIPFGGSCAMLGEDEADEDAPGTFNGASPLARILVVAAGPVFNFILAFIMGMILIGISGTRPALVTEVTSGSAAEAAGLQVGDEIVKYEGNGIANISEISIDMSLDGIPKDAIHLTYVRNGQKHSIVYQPELEEYYRLGYSYSAGDDGAAEVTQLEKNMPAREAGLLVGDLIVGVNGTEIKTAADLQTYNEQHPMDGSVVTMTIKRGTRTFDVQMTPVQSTVASTGFSLGTQRVNTSFPKIIVDGIKETGYWIHVTVKSLVSLITGVFTVREMSGPVGIVSTVGSVYNQAKSYGALEVFLELLQFTILISANLGVMNLLPLPALDGGRLVFLIIEAIRRKPVNRELEGKIHFIGFAALMALMVFVCYNDVAKLI
jgi:regulator of sigma E protease